MLKVLAFTSIRSEYDLMSAVYTMLNNDPDIDLRLVVSGAHLSRAHGFTVKNIYQDGIPILAEVETLINSDSPVSRLKTASGLLGVGIDLVNTFRPDVIVYAGDREDVLVAAMIGSFLSIPTVHFFGGDHASDGHVDNPVRHATSKLSSLHFVSVVEHRDRLISLGERADRIHVIGSVALDKFVTEAYLCKEKCLVEINAKRHAYHAPLAILIFHPVEEERSLAGNYIRNAINALIDQGYHILAGGANTDPGHEGLVDVLDKLSGRAEVTFYKNASRNVFVNLFRHASMIVGNSSAGILEAASIPVPAINIGRRQKGRMCGSNVIFCEGDYQSIFRAVVHAGSDAFKAVLISVENPYGNGTSALQACRVLKSIDYSFFVKKPEDPLNDRL